MKKLLTSSFLLYALLLFALLLLMYACGTEEDRIEPLKGKQVFSFSKVQRNNDGADETSAPAFALLSFKDSQGNTQENVELSLSASSQGHRSEGLDLPAGNYQLLQFTILDAARKVVYATPKEGSALASYIASPLPLEFAVTQNDVGRVVPPVLVVTADDTPGAFGYASFGLNKNDMVLIKSNVKIKVGDVLYENVDARIRVTGYDAGNTSQWTKDFNFTGPVDNILEVKNGFHHYSIALIDKWGVNDLQSQIPAQALWDGRADGPLPVTYVLAGSKKAKKLSNYIMSSEVKTPGGGLAYQPDAQVQFIYDAEGRVAYIRHKIYNAETSAFEDNMLDIFTYEGDVVSKIKTTMNGRPYKDSQYRYGTENIITETLHYASELVCTQKTKTDDLENVNVTYNYTNGRGFVYAFDFRSKNIASDKTTEGGTCSTGTYGYDKNINPFRHLGYLDFSLQNWSASNKVTEDVHYFACGFPTIIPVKHAYTYDTDGYPVTKITTYKKGGFDDGKPASEAAYHSKVEYSYE